MTPARIDPCDGLVGSPVMVEAIVIDTGTGIPPEMQPQLFQPFVTTKGNGMGIGLSICRSIVDAHGGQDLGDAQSRRRRDIQFHPAFLGRGLARFGELTMTDGHDLHRRR